MNGWACRKAYGSEQDRITPLRTDSIKYSFHRSETCFVSGATMAKTIQGQVLASTSVDSHGEQRSKEDLEEILEKMPPQMALNQHHDHAQPTVGILKNFRVEAEGSGWALKADVTFTGPLPTFGGFSFSSTDLVHQVADSAFAVYVPLPYYRDTALLQELAELDGGTSSGRWVKKADGVAEIALIVSLVNLVFAPAWRRLYEDHVHPRLVKLTAATKAALLAKGATNPRIEFLQLVSAPAGNVQLYFVPSEEAADDVVFGFALAEALQAAKALIETEKERPIRRIVMVFDARRCIYEPVSIVYTDGTAEQLPRQK
jgi:hypothetical protein